MRVVVEVGTYGICGKFMGTYGWKGMWRPSIRSENQGLPWHAVRIHSFQFLR